MAIRDYPWTALERVPREALRGLGAARARWSRAFAPEKLAFAVSELTGASVALELDGFSVGPPNERLSEVTLAAGGASVTIGAELALVLELLERVLGRPFALKHGGPLLEPPLAGAFAALVLEAARRTANEPLSLAPGRVDDPGALRARVKVEVEGRPFAAYALVTGAPASPSAGDDVELTALGELALAVPLVVGLSLVARAELAKLRVGSAFVPGEGLFVDRAGNGCGALAAATAERGVRVELGSTSGIVLGDETLDLTPDLERSGDDMDEPNDDNRTLTDAVLEAPVVVRVELGAVSMTAGDWGRLRPGDVIETGRRVAEPVSLRVGGRVVARGELVDIDGELGVRVRELFSGSLEP